MTTPPIDDADAPGEVVREKYAAPVRGVSDGSPASCCGARNASSITSNLYSVHQVG